MAPAREIEMNATRIMSIGLVAVLTASAAVAGTKSSDFTASSSQAGTIATLVADQTLPQAAGSTINLTASATGGLYPYMFKFLITTDGFATYSVLRDWSTTNTFAWTPAAPANYTLGIWVRSAFNTTDVPEAAAALALPISASLTINTMGVGAVRSSPNGINTGAGAPSAMFAANAVVTLSAAPMMGYEFAGWSPSECAAGTIAMTKNTVCSVTFIPSNRGFLDASNINLTEGWGDVFTYDPATGARWFEYNSGALTFNEKRGDWPAHLQLYPADWNGDGLTDFLVYNSVTGAWTKATNNGAGDFTYYSGAWPPGLKPYVMDLDADGRSDVFNYAPMSGVWTRCVSTPGDGTVDFACGANGQWPAGLSLYVGDFNGDLIPDFFVYNAATGQWTLALNSGTAFRYDASGTWPAGLAVFPADYNGDGRTDLFVSNPATGDWSLLITDLTLLPFPAPGYKFTNYPGHWSTGWTLTVGDFNGDSRADLFLFNEATGDHYVATSNGTSFTLSARDTWSPGWKVQTLPNAIRANLLLYDPKSGQWYLAESIGPNMFTYSTGFWAPGLEIFASRRTMP
jgi:hypothetical protein